MNLARWLTAAALLAVLAAPQPGCRRYIEPPKIVIDGGLMGGAGGTSGAGGMGGSGGMMPDTLGSPVDAIDRLDSRPSDRPDAYVPDGPAPCGRANQPCCPGNRCDGTGCCNQENICLQNGSSCSPEAASCVGSSCGSICGGLKERCCVPAGDAGLYCTFPLTNCLRTDASANCESCGNTGEQCCRDSYCEPPNRRCVGGRCVAM
jgi:hypothetical protein